jgi:hypothetical protein
MLKIIWLTNVTLPEASILLTEKINPHGGWLDLSSKELSNQENIELNIITPRTDINDVEMFNGEKIKYYMFPQIKK